MDMITDAMHSVLMVTIALLPWIQLQVQKSDYPFLDTFTVVDVGNIE